MPQRERYRLFMRQRQLFDEDANPVVVNCTGLNTAEYIPGSVSQVWQEFTHLTRGLEKLSLSWDSVNSGTSGESTETNPGGSNYDKGISADVIFNDEAFTFIYNILLGTPCGILNAIEVMITDEICKKQYRIFEIKADNLAYAPFDAPCELEVKLREADPVWHCIHKTFIWDNWQEWFIDGSSKQHPCFLTAIEPRPRLITSARMGLSIFGRTIPVFSAIFNENDDAFRRIQNVDNFIEAPLIRDFIDNVCDKCGITADTIFHDEDSPYYNACLYNPVAGAMHKNDGSSVTSPALWFHFENRWNITLAELLDKLKVLFAAEWYVTPNSTLVFKPKTTFLQTAPIYDFTAPGALPIWNLRYTFNGQKKPAYGRYQYTIDASDLATQEAQPLYNDIVDYDGPVDNEMLEGNVAKNFEFASTGFVRDGRAQQDYLHQVVNDGETVAYALIVLLAVIIASLLAGVLSAGAAAALAGFLAIWVASIAIKAEDLRDYYDSAIYTGAVRLTSEQVATPRILLWDGVSMNRAKVVSQSGASISPNTYYNPDSEPYLTHNKFQYSPAAIFNYPMYFDSFFEGNMYDTFHEVIDNPLRSLDTHQNADFYTDLCCELQDILGVWDGEFARIGYFVILENRGTYIVKMRIEHFELNANDERITFKGLVFKENV